MDFSKEVYSLLQSSWPIFPEIPSGALSSSDDFDEVFNKLFQLWYQQAALFAKGSLDQQLILSNTQIVVSHLLVLQKPDFFLDRRLEDFMSRSALENFKKLISIFYTKPKFYGLLDSDEGKQFVYFLHTKVFLLLQSFITKAGLQQSNKIDFLKALKIVSELGIFLVESFPGSFPETPFPLDVKAVCSIACTVGNEQMLRTNALELLKTYGKKKAIEVCGALSDFSVDSLALETFWECGGINYPSFIDKFGVRVLKSTTSSSTVTPFSLELVFSINQAIQSCNISVQEHSNSLVPLLRICDQTRSHYKEEQENERNQEMIELLSTMIAQIPDNLDLLRLCLNPVSLEALNTVEAYTSKFSEKTWIQFLFPFLNGEISKMSLQGVSGKMIEQEIINFVRDCARIYYINQDSVPSKELGYNLFCTILEAIRHGYIETERFPYLNALICHFHFSEGSAEWIRVALSNQVCHNHKTNRAVFEIIMRLLSIFDDKDTLLLDNTQLKSILTTICETPTIPAFLFLTDLCINNGAFFSEHQEIIRKSLLCVDQTVSSMIAQKSIDNELLVKITDLLRAFVDIIAPLNANILFENVLKAMALTPLGHATAYSDLTLEKIVHKVPHNTPLSLPAVEEALRCTGPLTRCALAEFTPHLCLQDKDATVRAEALRVLARRPDLLKSYSQFIIKACTARTEPSYDGDLDLHDNELALAAAPLLGMLAVVVPDTLTTCIKLLIAAANLSAKNDSRNIASPTIIESINHIALQSNQQKLLSFIISPHGLVFLPKLEKISNEWKNITNKNVTTSFLKANKSGYSALIQENQIPYQPHNVLLSTIKEKYESGDLINSVRLCYQLCMNDPILYEREGKSFLKEQILPAFLNLLPLPFIDQYGFPIFSEAQLQRYEEFFGIMLELQSSFIAEAEEILQISRRISDLNGAVVRTYLEKSDINGARQFLRSHNIHDPALISMIDQQELHKNSKIWEAQVGSNSIYPQISSNPSLRSFNASNEIATWKGIHALQNTKRNDNSFTNLIELEDIPQLVTTPESNSLPSYYKHSIN